MPKLTYGDLAKYNEPALFLTNMQGNEWSATSGDYWMMSDDEPITDHAGTSLVLARRHVTIETVAGELDDEEPAE